ncbi:hypothetical protein L1276_003781 [Flavobacterium sp. HSC-32F16]|uniref:hypothetical protein n=1 Tax=Flavobacterium sp. HSC-32F16 TaxID=2910964 RepID=UPI0020A42121|nr:hypothetical protein [Flavobacterium sp. HSC-32F16]MCP2028611.1 hypothetical protein [Flavobacterium sp. HSC-32F16]
MKHLLSIIIILTLSFQAFSQKKQQKKTKSKANDNAQIEMIQEAMPKMAATEIDTLHIYKGKRYVFLVDVNKYSGQSDVDYASNNNSEEAELRRNFAKDELEIIKIHRYSYVIFENKKTLDISSDGDSYQAFAYWSGKLGDNIEVQEGTRMATEFVSKNIGVNKESSYNLNAIKYKKEVAILENKNKITSKSKEVMKAVLSKYIFPINKLKDDDVILFKQSNAKIKTINSYLVENGKETRLRTILLNENGLPITTTNYDKKEERKTNYIYKDDLLIKIMSDDRVLSSINYDDGKMIFSGSFGDANETEVNWLENGVLLKKSYILMSDNKSSHMNTFAEEKIENDCNLLYINNVLWTKNCSTKKNVFPFIHKYTSYQDEKVLQFRKSKLEKKDDKTFEKYYSDAESEDQKDNFKLFGTFFLNEYNLVSSYNFTKDKTNRIVKIEYTYYQ